MYNEYTGTLTVNKYLYQNMICGEITSPCKLFALLNVLVLMLALIYVLVHKFPSPFFDLSVSIFSLVNIQNAQLVFYLRVVFT
jgi:hypothetical protein